MLVHREFRGSTLAILKNVGNGLTELLDPEKSVLQQLPACVLCIETYPTQGVANSEVPRPEADSI